MMLQPVLVFIFFTFTSFILIGFINKHRNFSKKKEIVLKVALIFNLTFFLISFSAVMGPKFFEFTGYTVNNTSSDTITAFDETSCFASSILTAVIGLMSVEISRKVNRT